MLEQYETHIGIEASTLETLARTKVLPAAIQYLNELVDTVEKGGRWLDLVGVRSTASEVSATIDSLVKGIEELSSQLNHHSDDGAEGAAHARDKVIPSMAVVREAADRLEELVPGDYWSLPTYSEMLFLH